MCTDIENAVICMCVRLSKSLVRNDFLFYSYFKYSGLKMRSFQPKKSRELSWTQKQGLKHNYQNFPLLLSNSLAQISLVTDDRGNYLNEINPPGKGNPTKFSVMMKSSASKEILMGV